MSLLRSITLLPAALLLISRAHPASLPSPAAKRIDFIKDIQPIFTKSCIQCHGPARQEAQFRLDSKEIALKGGELGVAIVPGKSADSLLIQAVSGIKTDLVMPKKGDRLTPEQIALLRTWIDQGANWPDEAFAKTKDPRNHWAFIAPVRPPLPAVKPNNWCRNSIDNFIFARLEQEQLKPSPEADRRTLIRRLSLDLTGLPPTIKEVGDFVADRRSDAYELLVERLLASPHYGERWGRHWLDLARYADTNGYEKDKPRSIWPYRDWVIKALNRDLPFDQFVIDQLAGDLLPDATLDQRIATGFLRNSMLNQEGGIEPEQFRVEAIFDRMDTLGKSLLGLTINCCQCHNHKYDPFSQKEYYQLYSFLNNDDESFIEVPTPREQERREEILTKVATLERRAMKEATNLVERMKTWEAGLKPPTANWVVLEPKDWHNFATKFEKQDDNSLLAGGDLQPGGVIHVWAETQQKNITRFRLEALTNPNLMYGGPGLLGKGTFLVREFVVEAYPLTNVTVAGISGYRTWPLTLRRGLFAGFLALFCIGAVLLWTRRASLLAREGSQTALGICIVFGIVGLTLLTLLRTGQKKSNVIKFSRAVADLEAPGFSATNAIDGTTSKGGWTPATIPLHRNENHVAIFECAEPCGFPDGTRLHFTIHQKIEKEKDSKVDKDSQLEAHMLGCFRLSTTTSTGPLVADTLSPEQRAILAVPPQKRSDEQRLKLFETFRLTDPAFTNLNVQIVNLFTNWPYPATTLVLQRRPHPRITRIFKRGDRLRPTDEVEPAVPVVLNAMATGAPRDRLGLAKWIVDTNSPTTARVFVNRVWQTYFGQGLVTTSEDFGTRVETPSHPELLDWLACEFMQPSSSPHPWSIKHLHRLIVTSATYRQTSRVVPELEDKDPYNRLLARAPRLRVEGEIVEDIALAVSGLLNPKIGGPSIYPPIPTSVGDTVFGEFTWPETKGEDRHRRAMYTFAKRSLPFPSLSAFDAPSGETSCPRRVRSNTPLQALTTLNEKTFVESAQMLALRIMKEGGPTDQSRVTFAFELCTGRKPTPSETEELLKFWREQYDYFEDRTAAAVNVSVCDVTNLPPDVNLHKAAAWALVSRAILNLDETITRE